jgi:hypothetical protein
MNYIKLIWYFNPKKCFNEDDVEWDINAWNCLVSLHMYCSPVVEVQHKLTFEPEKHPISPWGITLIIVLGSNEDTLDVSKFFLGNTTETSPSMTYRKRQDCGSIRSW